MASAPMPQESYELRAAQRFGANWVGRQEKNKREEEGNSCGRRELWNNLPPPRSVTSLEVSRTRNRLGISYLRRLEVTSCKAAMRRTEPAGGSERSAGERVNQTGLAG